MEPAVSVIIVSWNGAGFLDACLSALRDHADLPVEVICVDNASEDDSVAVARANGAKVIALDANLGFPRAVNRGLDVAAAPLVLLLNPDVVIGPGTLRRCVEVLGSDPSIGLVGANLRGPDGGPDRAAARRLRSLSSLALEATGLSRVAPALDRQYFPGWDRTDDRDVPCVNGAFMLMRTAVLRELGGLDTSAFMYLEDQDLCHRLAQRGLRTRFVGSARATHIGGGPTNAASPARQAAAYVHRLDGNVEIVARRQGPVARVLAIALLVLRSSAAWALAVVQQRPDRILRHREALAWLVRQPAGRRPPPPIV